MLFLGPGFSHNREITLKIKVVYFAQKCRKKILIHNRPQPNNSEAKRISHLIVNQIM